MGNRSDRASDFRRKEVIDISDGKRLGYITDVEIDLEKGIVVSVIIPGKRRFFGILPPSEDIVVKWNRISKIGDDIILVNADYEDVRLSQNQSMP